MIKGLTPVGEDGFLDAVHVTGPHAGTAGAVPSNFVDLIALGESSDYFMLTENIMEDLQYAVNGHAGPGGGDEGEDEFA